MSNPEKVVLILVGLVGSGKSAFATALESHFPRQWRRCNQDDLGNRAQVEILAKNSLRKGLSVCIDRTNIDESQRAHWIRLAHEFPGTRVWVIFFDTPYEVCALRLQRRTSHPTIHSPEMGLSVLSRFARDLSVPSANEGFHCMVSLEPVDTKVEYSDSDIVTILDRVRSSEAVMQSRPKPMRISWAERRGQSRGGPTRDIKTQSNYLSRAWQQGTVFPTQNTSSSIQPATEVDGDIGVQAGHTHGEVSPLLKDLLGVD